MSKDKLIANIDTELKIQLKIIAAKKQKTISEIITELIEEYIDKNK